MKIFRSLLIAMAFLVSLSSIAYAGNKEPLTAKDAVSYVFDYVKESSFDYEPGVATVFTNFIVKEKGENYAIDFLVTEKAEIMILSVRYEDEFYRMDEDYNARYVQKYRVPVSTII